MDSKLYILLPFFTYPSIFCANDNTCCIAQKCSFSDTNVVNPAFCLFESYFIVSYPIITAAKSIDRVKTGLTTILRVGWVGHNNIMLVR